MSKSFLQAGDALDAEFFVHHSHRAGCSGQQGGEGMPQAAAKQDGQATTGDSFTSEARATPSPSATAN